MQFLTQFGLILLAAGALLGWPIALQHLSPEAIRWFGVRHPRRLLQMHIDYVLMGLILIAVSLAVPGLPAWNQVVLVIGTVVNPLLFLPLAFWADLEQTLVYRAISVASFLCVSAGTVGAAVEGLQR